METDDPFKDDAFKDNPFKEDLFKEDPFKEDPFKEDSFKDDSFKDDSPKIDNFEDNFSSKDLFEDLSKDGKANDSFKDRKIDPMFRKLSRGGSGLLSEAVRKKSVEGRKKSLCVKKSHEEVLMKVDEIIREHNDENVDADSQQFGDHYHRKNLEPDDIDEKIQEKDHFSIYDEIHDIDHREGVHEKLDRNIAENHPNQEFEELANAKNTEEKISCEGQKGGKETDPDIFKTSATEVKGKYFAQTLPFTVFSLSFFIPSFLIFL